MKKVMLCLAVLLTLLLCGCSADRSSTEPMAEVTTQVEETAPAEETEPAVVETPTEPEETVVPEEADTYCQFIPVGETCQVDLDGDGTEETVCVTSPEEGEYGDGTLTVNDTTVTIFQEYPVDVYCLVDIYGGGATQLIGVQDYGASGDYVVKLYRYDGETSSVILLAEIEGLFSEPFYGGLQAMCTGGGNINTYKRLDVLQTWFAPVTWHYADGSLTMEEPEVYDVYDVADGVGIDVTTNEDVLVFSDMSLTSDAQVLPAGSELHLLGTDNKEWVKFVVQGSTEYQWFHLIDSIYIQSDLAGECVYACDALENLCLFD